MKKGSEMSETTAIDSVLLALPAKSKTPAGRFEAVLELEREGHISTAQARELLNAPEADSASR